MRINLVMTSYIKQLTHTASCFFLRLIVILSICSTYFFFIQPLFALSINSSDDTEVPGVVLVDELKYDSFINELSSYNHIAIEELDDSEARVLLSQANYQNLYIRDTILEDIGNLLESICGVGAFVGFLVTSIPWLINALKSDLVPIIPVNIFIAMGAGCILDKTLFTGVVNLFDFEELF